MDKGLVDGKIGSEFDYKLELKDGKLRLEGKYGGAGGAAGAFFELEPNYFLDKLADAIPGEIDDMVIAALKGALK